jgi:predicted aldo/keto reductase-like oxidoreductase
MHTTSADEPISRRPFGRHPDQVSILGLGGYHLGKAKTSAEAVRIVHEAIGAGINFLYNAWEYHDGESEERRKQHGFPSQQEVDYRNCLSSADGP